MLRLYLLAVVACNAVKAGHWPENPTDESAEKSMEDYDCSTNEHCDLVDDTLKKKKGFSALFGHKGTQTVARPDPVYFQNLSPFSCSCATKMTSRDLGKGYYPQHVVIAECKYDNCFSGLKCREKEYSIVVLKRREIDDNISSQLYHKHMVPKDLRKAWTFETIRIPIGCECGP